VTDAVLVSQDGARTPYTKAISGKLREGVIHHAEQRMEQGTKENGETVLAQAPTKSCCDDCRHNRVGPRISVIVEIESRIILWQALE